MCIRPFCRRDWDPEKLSHNYNNQQARDKEEAAQGHNEEQETHLQTEQEDHLPEEGQMQREVCLDLQAKMEKESAERPPTPGLTPGI